MQLSREVLKMLPPDFEKRSTLEQKKIIHNLPTHLRSEVERALFQLRGGLRHGVLPNARDAAPSLQNQNGLLSSRERYASSPARTSSLVSQIWSKRYNGPGVSDDEIDDMAVDRSENLYITGHTNRERPYPDYYLIKYSADGTQQWSLRPGHDPISISVDTAGNILVFSDSVQKYDTNGSLIWSVNPHLYYFGDLAVDNSGNVYLTGSGFNMDILTQKFDPAGYMLWSRSYPGGEYDRGIKLTFDNEKNVYVLATYGSSATVTIKYDSTGTQLWGAIMNGSGPHTIAVDDAQNVFIANSVSLVKYDSYGNTAWTVQHSYDVLAVDDSGSVFAAGWIGVDKYDRSGALVWSSRLMSIYDITRDSNNDIIATGISNLGGNGVCTTIKWHNNGDSVWAAYHADAPNPATSGRLLAIGAAGNIYVAGEVGYRTEHDIVAIKYSSVGAELWTDKYDGPHGGGDDEALVISVDTSGHCYVSGSASIEGGGVYTIKYDSNGDSVWTVHTPDVSYPSDILIDDSENVYIATCSGDLIKYDNSGRTLWQRKIGWYPINMARAVNGNILASATDWNGDQMDDFATIEFTPRGDTVWVAHYGGPAHFEDIAFGMAQDSIGNVYITGQSYNGNEPNSDIVTIKYDRNGTEKWVRRYNNAVNGLNYGMAVVVDKRQNVYTAAHGGVAIKYDSSGSMLWVTNVNVGESFAILVDQRENVYMGGSPVVRIDSSGSEHTSPNFGGGSDKRCLLMDQFGNIYAACGVFRTVKYNPNLDTIWTISSGTEGALNAIHGLALDNHGNVYVTGDETNSDGDYDWLTVKYQQRSAISGTVYLDLNCNGMRDAGEPGLSGWTVQLSGSASVSAVSDTGGHYKFANLGCGTYSIQAVHQNGWLPTSTPGYTDTIRVDGMDLTAHDFGNYYQFLKVVVKGWNLLSVPDAPMDYLKDAIFPKAVSQAFCYQGSYLPKDTMRLGVGYWLKFLTPDTLTIPGIQLLSETVPVRVGWNLVGSISSAIGASGVTSNPPGLVTSQFFGYSGGYATCDSILAGRGYWVKVNQSGSLILLAPGEVMAKTSTSSRIHIIPTPELPPPPPDENTATRWEVPTVYAMEQAYPNPFNSAATIRYQLPSDSKVMLKVYNTVGQIVAILVDVVQPAGYKQVEWNASNDASGVYFYRLEATSISDPSKTFSSVKKMILVR